MPGLVGIKVSCSIHLLFYLLIIVLVMRMAMPGELWAEEDEDHYRYCCCWFRTLALDDTLGGGWFGWHAMERDNNLQRTTTLTE